MNNIFILDGQNDDVIGHINKKYVIDNEHEKDLPSHKDYFRFTVLADNKHAEHLTKRNGLIIPGEDGELLEFRIFESVKYRNNEGLFVEVHALATYLDLKNQKIFDPQKTPSETALQHATTALDGTEWQVGNVDFKGVKTLDFDNPFNSYDYILRIAREFELEPRFYIETDGNKITGRYVDLVERIGEFRGRTIEFGRDLQSIERKEDTSEVVTALWVYGPQREDGTRLKVLVEDDEARQRWGRRGQHIIDYYEPETENQDITEERLRTLGEMELRKRINAVVTYEAEILDLENVPGLENKKIRFGDTIRIKDTKFNPPLYVEARVFNVKRDVFDKSKKTVQLGDYREYTEEEVKELFRQMQAEIRRRLERLVLVSIISSAGNVFKNGVGSTELTAKTFLSGNEVDEDGTKYEYRWRKFDKNGDYVPEFYEEGKTITVNAIDIDEKATFRVEIILDDEVLTVHEITLTNVFDGEDGEPGPPGPKGDKGEDGKTFYTWIKYADTPTSGMSDSPEGKEYIGIAYNKETPTPSTNYDDYVWAKFKGEQGIPGPPGEDGQPTYTWVKYADDEHGNGMSDSPDGKLYIGLAFNKTTPEESNNPADYTWSLMPQNIEVGGRNLIRNSDFSNGMIGYGLYSHPSFDGTVSFEDGVVKITSASTVVSGFYVHRDYRPQTLKGQVYTVTIWAKGFGTMLIGQEGVDGGLATVTINSDDYMPYSHTFTPNITSTNAFIFYVNSPTDGIYVDRVKLEKGHKATDWTRADEDVQEQIDEAKQEAEEAKQEAQQAQTTADGKNTVFRQSSQPPTSGRKIGDVWFDTSRDNLMHVFNGQQWVEAKWGEQSIVANSITANHIKSLVGLNVNDQFIVDSNGNVKFAGHLEGATGTFSGTIEASEILGSEFIITTPDGFYPVKIDNEGSFFENGITSASGDRVYTQISNFHELPDIVSDFNETHGPRWRLSAIRETTGGAITELREAIYKESGIQYNSFSVSQTQPFIFDMSKAEFTGELSVGGMVTAAGLTSTGSVIIESGTYSFLRPDNPNIELRVANSSGQWGTVRAYTASPSSEKWKTDIKDVDFSAIEVLKQSKIYSYIRDGKKEREIGFIIERETPDILKDGEGINSYSHSSLNTLAIKELIERVENIEERLERLENEGNSV